MKRIVLGILLSMILLCFNGCGTCSMIFLEDPELFHQYTGYRRMESVIGNMKTDDIAMVRSC